MCVWGLPLAWKLGESEQLATREGKFDIVSNDFSLGTGRKMITSVFKYFHRVELIDLSFLISLPFT